MRPSKLSFRRAQRLFVGLFRFYDPGWTRDRETVAPVARRRRKLLDYCNPISWMRWWIAFCVDWMLSRPYASLQPALPSVAIGLSVAVMGYFCCTQSTAQRETLYRSLFSEAINEQNFEAASIAIETLVDLHPESVELQYQRAIIEHRRGNLEAADKQIEPLVRVNRHGKAALWMISQKCDLGKLNSWSSADHESFREWMDIALSDIDGENLLAARVLMSSYLVGIGAQGEAIRFLKDIVPDKPELALMAASLSKSQHDVTGTNRFGEIARKHFEAELSKKPSDVERRINLARTMIVIGQDEAAARLLNDGYRLTKDEHLAGALGEALVSWSNRLGEGNAPAENLLKRLEILRAAMGVLPNDRRIAESIVALILECRTSQDAKVRSLRESILRGTSTTTSNFIRGTLALLDNNFSEAKVHLELAAREQPNVPTVLNNLAVAIAGMEGGDLEQALKLSNAAIAQHRDHPYLLETRGQILVKLQRWQEAIASLEPALRAQELKSKIYPSLALAYREVGLPQMAKYFARVASEASPE